MLTLFEIGFILAFFLPAAAVILCGGATLASAVSVYLRSHGRDGRIAGREQVAIHHPVGR
jgi:hypothetical protein